MLTSKLLYEPRPGNPMRVVFFASGGPGNLSAAFDVEDRFPNLMRIEAVAADRGNIPAITLAKSRGRLTVVRDFASLIGSPHTPGYLEGREHLHDEMLNDLARIEGNSGFHFDLAVLAYRRIITGALLNRFKDRMINQHPADLTELQIDRSRRYTGIEGLGLSLADGKPYTRTSTILVGPGVDTGEILCQGPRVPTLGVQFPSDLDSHETNQKKLSDWPSLRFALESIAKGHFALADSGFHPDGCRSVLYRGMQMGYGGVDLDECRIYDANAVS
jgi:folate-dependent phosphoribosylglycinamide formyltransferase PurN